MKEPRPKPHHQVLRWSIAASAMINAFMISSGLFGPHTLYRRIADAAAAPPGKLVSQFSGPQEHSAGTFVLVALLSLAISFLFYAGVTWIVIEGIVRLRSLRRSRD